MADLSMQMAGSASPYNSFGTLANVAGAVVSLSLLAGIGVWGYQMVMRDVSGVPVVRALDGPMRIAPENPGGQAASHQGFAVNKVAGAGAAQPTAERLLLIPAQPGITGDDAPLGVGTAAIELAPEPKIAVQAPETASETTGTAAILALADEIANGVAPLSASAPVETPEVQTQVVSTNGATVATPEVIPVPEGALARSLRPQLRPADLSTVRVAAASVSAVQAAPQHVAAASIPAGTRLVQLGAFDSPTVARAEWERLTARFGDYFEGKQRVVQKATTGGRVFYRLRATGFADLSDARRFCSALSAQRADCIPVVAR
ncbi:SPOR domain-containing protein [Pseudaestuariivita sp.]|uniref:SPOR domain-containing protein n=1 Tax=Pseudaestuariivita sp. TaxID=2211669 RepID=UPI0040598CE2